MTSKRLDHFGKINRERVVSFTWEHKKYFGYEGDSLASALLANDIKVVGRSFKYHRPRGIMSCGVEESGAVPQSGGQAGPVAQRQSQLLQGRVDRGRRVQVGLQRDVPPARTRVTAGQQGVQRRP